MHGYGCLLCILFVFNSLGEYGDYFCRGLICTMYIDAPSPLLAPVLSIPACYTDIRRTRLQQRVSLRSFIIHMDHTVTRPRC